MTNLWDFCVDVKILLRMIFHIHNNFDNVPSVQDVAAQSAVSDNAPKTSFSILRETASNDLGCYSLVPSKAAAPCRKSDPDSANAITGASPLILGIDASSYNPLEKVVDEIPRDFICLILQHLRVSYITT